MTATIDRVQQVFRTLFDDEELVVRRETTASDVPNWDSMMHVSLMLAMEQEFRVRFTSSEVASMKNVGELIDLIARKSGIAA